MEYDVIIVGAGPAGLSAATYASRSRLKTAVFEKGLVGGQIALSSEIENYPGFENVMSGFELIDKMQKQAEKFEAEFIQEEIKEIKPEGQIKEVITSSNTYKAKVVIYAAGANPRKMGVPGEDKFYGRGVSYCATCDGALYRNKTVAVIGGGDSAVEEGIFLTKFATKVYIIHRRDKLRANPITQERAFKNEKIEFIWDSVVEEVTGDQFVNGLNLYNKKTEERRNVAIDGVFVYIGILPTNELLKDKVETDDQGFLIVDKDMKTKYDGLYAAGDVLSKTLRQVVTATSDGAIAAFMAEKYIEETF